MRPYTETPAYLDEVQKLELDITRLVSVVEETKAKLKSLPVKKRNEPVNSERLILQKRRDGLKSRLVTRKGKLARLRELRLPLWYLVEFLSAAHGELWTAEQAESWSKELAAHEGRGEKALRMRYGVTGVSSNGDCDIILGGQRIEVKNLQGRSGEGKFMIQDIQTGHHGRKAYTRWMGQAAEEGRFRLMSHDEGQNAAFRDAIFSGEVTQGLLYHSLPSHISEELQRVLSPSAVLATYDTIVGTTRFGSITIPKVDFDKAWSLKTVTKSGPKYTLRRAYVVERLQATQVTSAAAA